MITKLGSDGGPKVRTTPFPPTRDPTVVFVVNFILNNKLSVRETRQGVSGFRCP